jgi:mycothiol synthase
LSSHKILDREKVHGRAEYEFPQLELVRPGLEDLPALTLPEGYTLRHYEPGDEAAWGAIMMRAFSAYWDGERFRRLFLPHFGFTPERVLFVCWNGSPVGSASAFAWPGLSARRGYIHMVGVLEEHCGHGLGYWLAVASLLRLREQGFSSAMLQTESFRLPAIKHYLRLGFAPALVAEDQRQAWMRVLGRIGREDLIESLDLQRIPVMSPWSFWWRTTLVTNYASWLNLKADVMGR